MKQKLTGVKSLGGEGLGGSGGMLEGGHPSLKSATELCADSEVDFWRRSIPIVPGPLPSTQSNLFTMASFNDIDGL